MKKTLIIIFGLIVILCLAGILAWNIVGLSVLTLTGYAFVSAFFFTDFVESVGGMTLVPLPYLLLPAILLPIAIFYHVVSIRQNVGNKT